MMPPLPMLAARAPEVIEPTPALTRLSELVESGQQPSYAEITGAIRDAYERDNMGAINQFIQTTQKKTKYYVMNEQIKNQLREAANIEVVQNQDGTVNMYSAIFTCVEPRRRPAIVNTLSDFLPKDLTGVVLEYATENIEFSNRNRSAIKCALMGKDQDLKGRIIREAAQHGYRNYFIEVLREIRQERYYDSFKLDLSNVDLHGIKADGFNLSYSLFKNTNFEGADLRRANINYSIFAGANLSYTNMKSIELAASELAGANMTGAKLDHASLRGGNLGVHFTYMTYLSRASLQFAKLAGADLQGCDMIGADLRCADLNHAKLGDSFMSNTQFGGANLSFADMENCRLSDADLRGANMQSVKLNSAKLMRADLTKADLTGANLRGADLTGANLTGAKLKDADLRNAILTDAILPGKTCIIS